ncbi:MAG: hypothetical protein J5806_04390 [Lentisphaeria bacterium]|nr:hypothetical protein [Lentisphaeria bacterium]
MILNRPLTAEEQRRSQLNFYRYDILNGISYACLGETVIILFAVQLNCSNQIISVLSGMIYFGYLLLPLGKIVSARVGAVRCQVFFWIIRNLSALLAGLAAPVSLYLSPTLAAALLLTGAFLFYGARAAGIVVVQPLYTEITGKGDRAEFVGRNWKIFYTYNLLTILAITGVLYWTGNNIWTLTGIIVLGAAAGITSTRLLSRIDETGKIVLTSRAPARSELVKLLKDNVFRRMLAAGMILNLSVMLLVPFCTLALKRGYGIGNGPALVYYVIFLTMLMLCSRSSTSLIRRAGPRNVALAAYALLLVSGSLWLAAPEVNTWWIPALVMIGCACAQIAQTNAMSIYFLDMIAEERQVFASILVAVISGAGAGILGMAVSAGLLKLLAGLKFYRGLWPGQIGLYQAYFCTVILLLLPAGVLVYRMIPVPLEKRLARRNIVWSWLYPHQPHVHDGK